MLVFQLLELILALTDTPIPGVYHIRDFLEEAELNPVRKTYGFKGVGRKAQPLGVRKGDLLLPGAYDYIDSIQEVLKHQASYSFKNCPRPNIVTLGIRDKTQSPLSGVKVLYCLTHPPPRPTYLRGFSAFHTTPYRCRAVITKHASHLNTLN
uniref:Uncharacterized protein n=1 Tax=Sander lucioperca TaxID=283035 RepID=A0A8C9XRI6_SANLU